MVGGGSFYILFHCPKSWFSGKLPCIWKVTTIGDAPIFDGSMITGGRVIHGFSVLL